MAAASPVVEEEWLIAFGHFIEEVDAVLHPALIEVLHIFWRYIGNGFFLTTAYRVHVIFAERHIFHELGARWAEGHFRVHMDITPFGIHIGDRVEATEVIKTHVLRL